jgi:hypothetical protein
MKENAERLKHLSTLLVSFIETQERIIKNELVRNIYKLFVAFVREHEYEGDIPDQHTWMHLFKVFDPDMYYKYISGWDDTLESNPYFILASFFKEYDLKLDASGSVHLRDFMQHLRKYAKQEGYRIKEMKIKYIKKYLETRGLFISKTVDSNGFIRECIDGLVIDAELDPRFGNSDSCLYL